MSEELKKLIEALRCSCTAEGPKDCMACHYGVMEEVRAEIPMPADCVDENGIGYWLSCDTEQMALDAADELERLGKRRKA